MAPTLTRNVVVVLAEPSSTDMLKSDLLTLLRKYRMVNGDMTGKVVLNLNQGGITEIRVEPVTIYR